MEKLLSIIVPTYNVSAYLADCIRSVAGKYVDEIEILIIDDGSTDDSGVIADQYAEKYSNITAYHKKNGGLSDARNYGLLRANGKYVFFLDSDDMVAEKIFPAVMEVLRAFDGEVLLWDAKLIDETGSPMDTGKEKYYSHSGAPAETACAGQKLIDAQLKDHSDFVTTVWLGAYRRDYLLENQFWFEKGLIHEDELWTPRVLLRSEKVLYIPVQFYRYRIRSNSIMTGGRKDRSRNLSSLIYIFNVLYAYYDWQITDASLRERMEANLTTRYLHKISQYNAYSYTEISGKIQKKVIWRTARGPKDRCRAGLLLVSGKLYCLLTNRIREK